jgi:hypothetical protein
MIDDIEDLTTCSTVQLRRQLSSMITYVSYLETAEVRHVRRCPRASLLVGRAISTSTLALSPLWKIAVERQRLVHALLSQNPHTWLQPRTSQRGTWLARSRGQLFTVGRLAAAACSRLCHMRFMGLARPLFSSRAIPRYGRHPASPDLTMIAKLAANGRTRLINVLGSAGL